METCLSPVRNWRQGLLILMIGVTTACAPEPNGASSEAVPTVYDSVSTADAVAVATQRLREHGQTGLTLVDVRRTQHWFTLRLYDLIVKDNSSDPDGAGYLNWDPFTGAQDDVGPVTFEDAQHAGDTVMVRFSYLQRRDTVILAMTRVDGSWRIANFIYPFNSPCHRDLALGLARFAKEIAAERSTNDAACND